MNLYLIYSSPAPSERSTVIVFYYPGMIFDNLKEPYPIISSSSSSLSQISNIMSVSLLVLSNSKFNPFHFGV